MSGRRPARATIVDVARRAGVSTATVSRVTNQTALVAPATAARVKAAIVDLDYRPHAAARILASHRTETIGLVFPQISGNYFPALLRGIANCASEYGYDLLIYSAQESAAHRRPYSYPVGEQNMDGMLVFTDGLPAGELGRLHANGFPVVLIHCSPPKGLRIPSVTIESRESARCLVDHLIEGHGRRRIAYLAGPDEHEDSHRREEGYRDALAAHRILYDPDLVAEGGFSDRTARAAVQQWLSRRVDIDAIFAGDDDSATGALAALDEAGRRVGEDIALVGFDDIEVARYVNPPLTTVRAPVERVGREAVHRLMQVIRTGDADLVTVLPTQIVIRRSCGC